MKKRIVRTISAFLVILNAGLFAQMFEKTERNTENASSKIQGGMTSNVISSATALDGPVDPTEYRIGPGDIFSVNIWAATPLNFQIPVTPEGTVIIPSVGEIPLAGKTLSEAKQLAIGEIKKKYLSGNTSFTLFQPRSLTVYLKGAVKEEGSFIVKGTQRVDAVVNSKYNVGGYNNIQQQDTTVAQRNIIVQHRDGMKTVVDIAKYFATLNTLYNPLLKDGDIIVVPYKNISNNFFGVYGAVIKEGKFEFVEGDSLTTAIKIARGTLSTADSGNIVIHRILQDQQVEKIKVNLRNVLNGTQNDPLLKSGDRIIVYPVYQNNYDGRVEILGEVMFPGYYPITKDSTYLSEIIPLAGGLTPRASLVNSQLYRKSVNPYEIAVERLESGRGGITPEDSAYYYLETDIRINRELVVVDFVGLFQKNDRSKDVILRNGDYINISPIKKTVYVFGQVIQPGHILFEPGKAFDYYINRAGGTTEYARNGDIKVIKSSTRQWLDPQETTIEPGDYVWVPKEPYRPFSYYITLYSQVFGIVATVVSLILLITR